MRVANQVIDNNGSLEATREQTLRIVRVFAA
jgi:dephospho-CoA kinase